MQPDDKFMFARWLNLRTHMGAKGDFHKSYIELVNRYSESHRVYHTIDHIKQCLYELDFVNWQCWQPSMVELAIWYHDIVYDTTRNDNEYRSGQLLTSSYNSSYYDLSTGVQLIQETKTHIPIDRSNQDSLIMIDIDLSILGQDTEQFNKYNNGIRQEYCWVPDQEFVENRRLFLNRLLARSSIYYTVYFQNKYEEKARCNISDALAKL